LTNEPSLSHRKTDKVVGKICMCKRLALQNT
jgi:hypothetical protein